jgi:hypothetical protein
LALGVGANTAIFTLINQLLLAELPVRQPDQLVSFGEASGGGVTGTMEGCVIIEECSGGAISGAAVFPSYG